MKICIEIDTDDCHDPANLRRVVRQINESTDRLAAAVVASGSTLNQPPPQLKEANMANPVLQQLVDAVQRNKVVVDSATELIEGIGARITAAVNEALANGATAEELAPLTNLVTVIEADASELAAAVQANTPTPPPVPVESAKKK